MFNVFTKREKQILLILGIWFALMIFFPFFRPENHPGLEVPFLLFFVLPIGIYILTDPERFNWLKK